MKLPADGIFAGIMQSIRKALKAGSFENVLIWGPRALGLLVAAYLSLFALDAFTGEKDFIHAIPDYLVHAAPAFLVLLIVLISWHRQWIAGIFFIALALYYTLTTLHRTDWILAIAGPLLCTGLFYLLSWKKVGKRKV